MTTITETMTLEEQEKYKQKIDLIHAMIERLKSKLAKDLTNLSADSVILNSYLEIRGLKWVGIILKPKTQGWGKN